MAVEVARAFHFNQSFPIWSCDLLCVSMMRYDTEQHTFLVGYYIRRKKSYDKCVRKFRQQYPDSTLPRKSYVFSLYKKWFESGFIACSADTRNSPTHTSKTQIEPKKVTVSIVPRI